tara:strand:+ start:1500 stop:1775 length:276 start_codon:yes stop_codon:yes gene_type:complete
MNRKLLKILVCPIDKTYPLKLIELEDNLDNIIEGIIYCNKCKRYYPIIEEIPIMLPDKLRNEKLEIKFLNKWKNKLSENILYHSNPFKINS